VDKLIRYIKNHALFFIILITISSAIYLTRKFLDCRECFISFLYTTTLLIALLVPYQMVRWLRKPGTLVEHLLWLSHIALLVWYYLTFHQPNLFRLVVAAFDKTISLGLVYNTIMGLLFAGGLASLLYFLEEHFSQKRQYLSAQQSEGKKKRESATEDTGQYHLFTLQSYLLFQVMLILYLSAMVLVLNFLFDRNL